MTPASLHQNGRRGPRSHRHLLWAALVLQTAVPFCLRASDADLILRNGQVVTLDRDATIQHAVAMKASKITAVGPDADVLKSERGPHTKLIDLQGKMVLPGLVDAHVHALNAALSEYRAAIPPLNSFDAVRSYIRQQASVTPKGEWIIVPRTFPTRLKEMQMPTRQLLDIEVDRPVLFDASYVLILNTYGLRVCGITRATPNPPRGEIVKDAAGEPTGVLKNADSLVAAVNRTQHFSEAEELDALEQQLRRYVAPGLTTVGDRAVDPHRIDLYQKLKAAGRLPVRVVMTWRPDAAQPTAVLQKVIQSAGYTTNTGDSWLKFGTFKPTLDGGMTIGTAYQRHPHGDYGRQLYGMTSRDDRGQLFIPPDKLLAVMRTARDRGWQLTTHDQGGGAIDTFLDTLEQLNREKPIAPTRSHVMHASFQSPEAILRMQKLAVG